MLNQSDIFLSRLFCLTASFEKSWMQIQGSKGRLEPEIQLHATVNFPP